MGDAKHMILKKIEEIEGRLKKTGTEAKGQADNEPNVTTVRKATMFPGRSIREIVSVRELLGSYTQGLKVSSYPGGKREREREREREVD